MAPIGRHLKSFLEANGHGREALVKTTKHLRQSLKEGKIQYSDIHLRELAEAFVGTGHANLSKLEGKRRPFLEAVDAVDASSFAAITGQLLVQRIKDKWVMAQMVAEQLTSFEDITNGNLGPQREPWLSDVAEQADQIQQGMPYSAAHFQPEYIDYQAPAKFGRLCFVTMEMIFSDLTKQAYDSADSVSRRLAIAREKRILRVILGLVNPHSWNGTTYNTYQTSAPWINTVSGLQLRDWTNINTIEQLFAIMTDPVTNEVIEIEPTAILVMPPNKYNAKRALHATGTRTGVLPGSGDPDTGSMVYAPNPLDKQYPVVVSKHGYNLLQQATGAPYFGGGLTSTQAKEYVVLADFQRAFVYRQVYPLRVVEAPPQNPFDFLQDIAVAVKASEYGTAQVRDPRFAALAYNN